MFDVKNALDLMLNGFLAHSGTDKADEWESLSPGAKATLYFIVQRSFFELFYCLNLIDRVILYWLDEPTKDVPKLGNLKHDEASDSDSSDDEPASE